MSNRFRVRRVRRKPHHTRPVVSMRAVSQTDKGYLAFTHAPGRRFRLHRAVMEVVRGQKIPADVLVRHLDDDKTNNHPDNLAIGTHLDNMADAVRNGSYRTPAHAAARAKGSAAAAAARRWKGAEQVQNVGCSVVPEECTIVR